MKAPKFQILSPRDQQMKDHALNLGNIASIGGTVHYECTSGTGKLLRISTHEFEEKIMAYYSVAEQIKESINNKLKTYVLKTSMRYGKIKEFHSSQATVEVKKQSPDQKRQTSSNFNDIISQRIVDRRDVLREIVCDYPETKKIIEFDNEKPTINIPTSIGKE
jgi:hypothetical protein